MPNEKRMEIDGKTREAFKLVSNHHSLDIFMVNAYDSWHTNIFADLT